MFEVDGRAAPGLYVAAWALAVLGIGAWAGAIAGGARGGAAFLFVGGIACLSLALTAAAGSRALQLRADGAVYAGPPPVLVFLAAFGLTLVAGFALEAVGVTPEGPPGILLSVVVTGAISLGLVALVVVSPGGLTWHGMGLRLPATGEGSAVADIAWGILLAVPTLFVAGWLAALLVAFLGEMPQSVIPPATDPAGVAVNLLAAAVVTPLWEELFFRGFATTAWARTRGAASAIVRGAIFFSFVHVLTVGSGDLGTALRLALITFVVRLPVALVLGWVFMRRRTLVAPIALHATYNAIPVLLVALGAGAGSG